MQTGRRQSLGCVRLATPVSQQMWGWAAACVTALIVAWLFLGRYTRREHVTGSLVPQAGLLNVVARGAGTVDRIDVTDGAHVYAGQAVLTVSGDRSSAAMGDTDKLVDTQLRMQETQLRATLAGLAPQQGTQANGLRTQIAMLHQQIAKLGGQIVLQRKQAAASADLVSKAAPLHHRGIVSTVEFDNYQATALAEQAQIKLLENQRLGIEQHLSSLHTQLAQLPLATAATAHQLRSQLAQLKSQRAENELQRNSVLRAARAGVVSALLVQPGQAVNAGQPLLTILPKGSRLLAQLLVPSSAIGFVHKGTPVVLHYEAFPYQKFGVQNGTVINVSRNALTPAEVTTLLGQTPPPVPLYRVQVKLAKQAIEAYGKPQALLPGMTVSADLLLDRRRMIQWIFEPLYGMAKRGGRHS